MQKNEAGLYLTPHAKINSKLIEDPSVSTIKPLEENRGNLPNLGLGNIFQLR